MTADIHVLRPRQSGHSLKERIAVGQAAADRHRGVPKVTLPTPPWEKEKEEEENEDAHND